MNVCVEIDAKETILSNGGFSVPIKFHQMGHENSRNSENKTSKLEAIDLDLSGSYESHANSKLMIRNLMNLNTSNSSLNVDEKNKTEMEELFSDSVKDQKQRLICCWSEMSNVSENASPIVQEFISRICEETANIFEQQKEPRPQKWNQNLWQDLHNKKSIIITKPNETTELTVIGQLRDFENSIWENESNVCNSISYLVNEQNQIEKFRNHCANQTTSRSRSSSSTSKQNTPKRKESKSKSHIEHPLMKQETSEQPLEKICEAGNILNSIYFDAFNSLASAIFILTHSEKDPEIVAKWKYIKPIFIIQFENEETKSKTDLEKITFPNNPPRIGNPVRYYIPILEKFSDIRTKAIQNIQKHLIIMETLFSMDPEFWMSDLLIALEKRIKIQFSEPTPFRLTENLKSTANSKEENVSSRSYQLSCGSFSKPFSLRKMNESNTFGNSHLTSLLPIPNFSDIFSDFLQKSLWLKNPSGFGILGIENPQISVDPDTLAKLYEISFQASYPIVINDKREKTWEVAKRSEITFIRRERLQSLFDEDVELNCRANQAVKYKMEKDGVAYFSKKE